MNPLQAYIRGQEKDWTGTPGTYWTKNNEARDHGKKEAYLIFFRSQCLFRNGPQG